MIYKKFSMQLTIETTSAQEFDEKVNQAVMEHAADNVEVIRRLDVSGKHCAYVVWEEEVKKPENARDRLSIKGIKVSCGDCPFFELPSDKRIKYVKCQRGVTTRACYERDACEWLCEQIELGNLEVEQ